MNLDSILNVVFFAVGLGIGLLQLYIAQHQFEVQQREKMDELRNVLTNIQQRLAVIEETTSERSFTMQDNLIRLVSDQQAVAEFTGETGKQIRSLIEAELKASGVHDSIQRTKSLEERLSQILERSASSLVDHSAGSEGIEPSIRENQVWELLAQGKTNNQIAQALGISLGSVRVHIASLFRKLGVTSRAGAVMANIAGRPNAGEVPQSPSA